RPGRSIRNNMAEYIASGKDRFAEGSVKVTADSDAEALAAARKKLPVITGLERVEADGSLSRITGLAFDSPNTVLESEVQKHEDRSAQVRRGQGIRRGVVYLFVFFGACIAMEYCDYHFRPRPAAHPGSTTMPMDGR